MPNFFAEVRFSPGIIPCGSGGSTFKTTIIKSGSDFERRNVARTEYLFEGDIGRSAAGQDTGM